MLLRQNEVTYGQGSFQSGVPDVGPLSCSPRASIGSGESGGSVSARTLAAVPVEQPTRACFVPRCKGTFRAAFQPSYRNKEASTNNGFEILPSHGSAVNVEGEKRRRKALTSLKHGVRRDAD